MNSSNDHILPKRYLCVGYWYSFSSEGWASTNKVGKRSNETWIEADGGRESLRPMYFLYVLMM